MLKRPSGAARWVRAAGVWGIVLPLCLGQSCATIEPDPGPPGPQGPIGPQGLQGPQGAQGEDGQLRIYGNGSAGAFNAAATGELFALVTSDNLQFTDFTVNAGVTLTVPSGTIIRCTGTFTNNGTIVVSTGAAGGRQGASPGDGISQLAPGVGNTVAAGFVGDGGTPGLGLTAAEARTVLYVAPYLGGGGGAGRALNPGGDGGGSFLVLAQTAIVNPGSITADGTAGNVGSGGGGGGVVLLASPASINHTGAIFARGGAGGTGNGGGGYGAGGGGGGGIVHLLSPTITSTGTIDVSPGAGGIGNGSPNNAEHSGGSGGGASGGDGGVGGAYGNLSGSGSGSSGTVGHSLQTVADPTSLF